MFCQDIYTQPASGWDSQKVEEMDGGARVSYAPCVRRKGALPQIDAVTET